jgi:hypothetical protein
MSLNPATWIGIVPMLRKLDRIVGLEEKAS